MEPDDIRVRVGKHVLLVPRERGLGITEMVEVEGSKRWCVGVERHGQPVCPDCFCGFARGVAEDHDEWNCDDTTLWHERDDTDYHQHCTWCGRLLELRYLSEQPGHTRPQMSRSRRPAKRPPRSERRETSEQADD